MVVVAEFVVAVLFVFAVYVVVVISNNSRDSDVVFT